MQLCVSHRERHQCGRRDTCGLLLRTFSRQLSSCQRQGGTRLYWLDPVSRYVLSHCCLLQLRLKALHRSHGWPEGKDKSVLHKRFALLLLFNSLAALYPVSHSEPSRSPGATVLRRDAVVKSIYAEISLLPPNCSVAKLGLP